ncbi:EamA family transporter [Candidatus Kaiserbacteria bacterium CG10_big_fil_rev_8_21_14_0_10_45_20]|uniref:EamA family transporter n=1 Tax=Candidatus Kaiserbacteria bacterium CG10_big_fil_rev_8_21_14_0_10_45_20 TaxID=1974607 RepID=A0A2H0UGI8_9BACT|nr:MAG: EamA family transporter [Candidatus Kaiserbacteria bacterium CG10_big_fil_rev_8_21_14_0_10_45_20]
MLPIIFAFLSAGFAALVAIFGKIGLESVDSTLATTVRGIIMAVFLVAVTLLLGKMSLEGLGAISNKAWLFIALSGIAGALSWLFYFSAIQGGTTSTIVAIDKLAIVFVVIFAGFFLAEGFSWGNIVGAVLMASGAILIALK